MNRGAHHPADHPASHPGCPVDGLIMMCSAQAPGFIRGVSASTETVAC
jgi:hypothetical protein